MDNSAPERYCSDGPRREAQHSSMTPAVEYRQFARDCGQLANHARNARQREFLISLARLWEQAARAAEQKTLKRGDLAAGIDLAA